MSTTVDQVYINTYEATVRHLAQQGITRLRPWVMERSVRSEAHNWERIAATAASAKAGRGAATPNDNTAWSRRQSVPATWATGDLTGKEDIVQMLVDPNSNYAKAQGMAMKRRIDDTIITAGLGASRDGAGGAVAFPAGQSIGADAPLSFDTITQVTELFLTNNIDPDEEKVWVLSPGDMRKLLQLTEATSADYNALRPLQDSGIVSNWMGYTWIVSTRLGLDATVQPTGGIYNMVMTRNALGLQMNADISAFVAQDPSASFDWRIYCESTFGAIRVEDEQLVRVNTSGSV
jgi:hypothetical protein